MFTEEIKKLTQRLDDVEERFEEIDIDAVGGNEYENLESAIYEMEREISEYSGIAEGNQFAKLNKLQKRISRIKKSNEFYDEDAELDRMFPNRHDDDFDEDSMSYDSVFGDD